MKKLAWYAAILGVGLAFAGACADDETDPIAPSGGSGGTPPVGGSGGTTTTSTSSSGAGGADGGSTSAGGSGAQGGSGQGGAGGQKDCTPITLGDFVLADTEPGGSSLAYELDGLDPNEQHILYLEFYDAAGPQAPGTFDLSLDPDDNYDSCVHCVLVYENFSLASPTAFYPASGELNVTTADTGFTGASAGSFNNVELVEVTLEGTTTVPVLDGRCLVLATGSWDTT